MDKKERRMEGKSLHEDARGVLARIAKIPNATVADLGSDKLRLREGDDRGAMIDEIRREASKMTKLTVESDHRLSALRWQYEALPFEDRMFYGEVVSFEDILSAVPDLDHLLSEIAKLDDGMIYFISKKGELIIGDGGKEPSEKTLGLDYHKSRKEATRVSYIDEKGEIVTIEGDDKNIPEGVRIISKRGLVTLDEYRHINKGNFEKGKCTWIEDGKNPQDALYAYWDDTEVNWFSEDPLRVRASCGSRRVLRVKLNFE